MANFRLVAFNQKGQLVPPTSGDNGLVELLAVGTEQSYTVLTKANLDSFLNLINSQDASALHHHNSLYFTKSELTSTNPADTGANKIIAGNPYGGYASVQTVLDTLYSDVDALGSLVFEWQNSVATASLLAPPINPLIGDRYLLGLSLVSSPSDDWAGFGGHIAEWTGTTWKITTPSTGMFISLDDAPQAVYYFNGSVWSERTFENNTGLGFIDITGGVVSLKTLAEKRIIVGDASDLAVAVDTASLGQVEASVDGLIIKDLSVFGGAVEYPLGSSYFPDNIADFSITHSKLDNDQPGRLLGFNPNENAVAVDIVGDVTFAASANQEMTTSIQPLAVKSSMIDWGSGTNQIDDTDIPANNTPVNYTGGTNLRAELEGIDTAIGSLQQEDILQNAEDLTFLKLNGTRAMSGNLDMGDQAILNAAEIRVSDIKDQTNNAAIDLMQPDALRFSRKVIFTGATKKIENLADGTSSTDAVNFGQLQASVTLLQNADTTNLQTATSYTDAQVLTEKTRAETAEAQLSTSISQEATARTNEDLTFVKLDGSRTVTGNLSFGGNAKIVQLSNGQDPLDAVNKSQLDAVNTALTSSINSEISTRTSADAALSSRLDVLETDPVTQAYVDAADTSLQTQLTNTAATINASIAALQASTLSQQQEILSLKQRVSELETDQNDSVYMRESILIQTAGQLNYIDLQHKAIPNSINANIDRFSINPDDDFTISVVGGVTRITWAGPLHATTGNEPIELNSVVKINYKISSTVFTAPPVV